MVLRASRPQKRRVPAHRLKRSVDMAREMTRIPAASDGTGELQCLGPGNLFVSPTVVGTERHVIIHYVTGGFRDEAGLQNAGSGPEPCDEVIKLLIGIPDLGNKPEMIVGQRPAVLIPPAKPSIGRPQPKP